MLCRVFILNLFALSLSLNAKAFIFSYGSQGTRTGVHTRYIEKLVSEFKKDFPDATVTLKASTSYLAPVIETLNSQFGESPPDVGIVGSPLWPVLRERKMLRPLSEVLSAAEIAAITKSLRPDLNTQYYGNDASGNTYSLPFNRSFAVLYVNLKAAPDFVDKFSLSWEELGKYLEAKKLKLSLPSGDHWIAESVLANALGHTTITHKKVQFTDPHISELIALLRKLKTAGVLELGVNQQESFNDFVGGKAAFTMVSMSSYRLVQSAARFPVQVTMPPKSFSEVAILGGGDLILPLSPQKKQLDAKSKKDIKNFIKWFYTAKGSALWAKYVGYLPVTKQAASSELYTNELKTLRTSDSKVFRNAAQWKIKSDFEVDDYCNVTKLRTILSNAFTAAIADAPDASVTLRKAEEDATEVLNAPCPK